jgi:hypothetical protein
LHGTMNRHARVKECRLGNFSGLSRVALARLTGLPTINPRGRE